MTRIDASRRLVALGLIWTLALAWSGWQPYDRATWWMEVAPVLIAFPILCAIERRQPPTMLAFWLIAAHGIVLIVGGRYSYARVPAGFAVQEWLGLARNPYDRFGHFVQGFVPAIVLRELLVRAGGLRSGRLLTAIVLACCLAVSAAYELIEFAAAMILGQGAEEFLGTQGDPWDTQWDMAMCLLGALVARATLGRAHDGAMARLSQRRGWAYNAADQGAQR